MKILSALLFLCFAAGCASSEPYMLPDGDIEASQAPGAAFSGDITYRKPMADHRNDKKYQFYYKNCWVDNENGRPWVSKRIYACNDAF